MESFYSLYPVVIIRGVVKKKRRWWSRNPYPIITTAGNDYNIYGEYMGVVVGKKDKKIDLLREYLKNKVTEEAYTNFNEEEYFKEMIKNVEEIYNKPNMKPMIKSIGGIVGESELTNHKSFRHIVITVEPEEPIEIYEKLLSDTIFHGLIEGAALSSDVFRSCKYA